MDNGELDFVYQYMNKDMQIKTGKCHSVSAVLENGKIEPSEQEENAGALYMYLNCLPDSVFEYKRATIEDIGELVRTRMIVLRAANKLSDEVDMPVVERESRAYYQMMPTYHNPAGKKAYIMNMYTAPEYRRQGIAFQTLDLLVKDAKKQCVSQIALEATDMGRPLYERYGFVKMEDEMELI